MKKMKSKKIKSPYRIGQLLYAQYITNDWILSKVIGISNGLERVKIAGVNDFGASNRPFDDPRIRVLSLEEEMILRLEN